MRTFTLVLAHHHGSAELPQDKNKYVLIVNGYGRTGGFSGRFYALMKDSECHNPDARPLVYPKPGDVMRLVDDPTEYHGSRVLPGAYIALEIKRITDEALQPLQQQVDLEREAFEKAKSDIHDQYAPFYRKIKREKDTLDRKQWALENREEKRVNKLKQPISLDYLLKKQFEAV